MQCTNKDVDFPVGSKVLHLEDNKVYTVAPRGRNIKNFLYVYDSNNYLWYNRIDRFKPINNVQTLVSSDTIISTDFCIDYLTKLGYKITFTSED